MAKLPKLTGKEIAKIIIEKLGFKFIRQTGSHLVYKHGQEIGPGLLNKIIKHDLKMTREEFMEYA